MPPDWRGIWTPRSTTKKYPQKIITFRARVYKAPKPPEKRLTIEEALTEDGREQLAVMAQNWLSESNAVLARLPDPTLEQRLGQVLLNRDTNLKALLGQWCPGRAQLQKADFGLKLRELVPDVSSEDAEELFDAYDADQGGSIDKTELATILGAVKYQAETFRLECVIPRAKAEQLRKRAAAAEDAVAAVELAARLETELEILNGKLGASFEVQLGLILMRHKIKVAQVREHYSPHRWRAVAATAFNCF